MLKPLVKTVANRLLPRYVLGCLDPIQRIIDTEVQVAAAALEDGGVALDAGAGEARHRRYFTRGRYVALDSGYGDPSWDYSGLDIRGDLEQLPLRSQSIDAVLCMVVLEHTRNPRRVLEEFSRVLKTGGRLHMVVPFLWEEHQAPHDYFRFTRYGVRALFESLPLRFECLHPMGGFFWVFARRCVNFLSYFQGGLRWFIFIPLAPFFGLIFPLLLYFLDRLDCSKTFSLGFQVRAIREDKP